MASDRTDVWEAEREPDAYMVERHKDGEWRRVVVADYEQEARHYARDERCAGYPARVIPLYRAPSAPEPAGDSEMADALKRLEALRDAADDLVATLDTVPADLAYGPRERQVRRYIERVRALLSTPESQEGS